MESKRWYHRNRNGLLPLQEVITEIFPTKKSPGVLLRGFSITICTHTTNP